MFIYSECSLNHPWICLIRAKDYKDFFFAVLLLKILKVLLFQVTMLLFQVTVRVQGYLT